MLVLVSPVLIGVLSWLLEVFCRVVKATPTFFLCSPSPVRALIVSRNPAKSTAQGIPEGD